MWLNRDGFGNVNYFLFILKLYSLNRLKRMWEFIENIWIVRSDIGGL